jgi:hypothetical protein
MAIWSVPLARLCGAPGSLIACWHQPDFLASHQVRQILGAFRKCAATSGPVNRDPNWTQRALLSRFLFWQTTTIIELHYSDTGKDR